MQPVLATVGVKCRSHRCLFLWVFFLHNLFLLLAADHHETRQELGPGVACSRLVHRSRKHKMGSTKKKVKSLVLLLRKTQRRGGKKHYLEERDKSFTLGPAQKQLMLRSPRCLRGAEYIRARSMGMGKNGVLRSTERWSLLWIA